MLFDSGPNKAEHPRNTVFERTEDGVKIRKTNDSGGVLFEYSYTQEQWDDIVSKMALGWVDVPAPEPEPEPEPVDPAPRAPTPAPFDMDETDPAPRAPSPPKGPASGRRNLTR